MPRTWFVYGQVIQFASLSPRNDPGDEQCGRSPEHLTMCCHDCDAAGMSRFSEGGTVAAVGIVARKGLSDRYPRKNQIFRQMPNSFPRPPSLVRITQGVCSGTGKSADSRGRRAQLVAAVELAIEKGLSGSARRGFRASGRVTKLHAFRPFTEARIYDLNLFNQII
jgi:hypothetical protein